MNTSLIMKLASAGLAAGAAFATSKLVELAWKGATGRDVPTEDSTEDSLTSLIVFAATSAAIVAVAQRYAYRGSERWVTPRLEARFGSTPSIEA